VGSEARWQLAREGLSWGLEGQMRMRTVAVDFAVRLVQSRLVVVNFLIGNYPSGLMMMREFGENVGAPLLKWLLTNC
jgi:hypothetical protein